MSDIAFQTGRCLQCAKPQCVKGCPVGYDIPKFLREAKNGDFSAAADTVGHLFGEVCGAICPESGCRAHCVLHGQGGVDIPSVEREVFSRLPLRLCVKDGALKGVSVAVVGGGVSGLTFAGKCYCRGADVTVYERDVLLRTLRTLPYFRLPRVVVDKICAAYTDSGIKFVKKDVTKEELEALRRSFDVVYLAVGAQISGALHAQGEQLATSADEFLRGDAFGETIVIGGGNTAMDCARLNVANGGKSIVAYRRTRADMPAFPNEILCAEREGVRFLYNLAPVAVTKGDRLCVTLAKTLSEGRGRLVLTEDTVTLHCDCVVSAAGRRLDERLYPRDKAAALVGGVADGNLYCGGDAAEHTLAAQAVGDAIAAFKAVMQKFSR